MRAGTWLDRLGRARPWLLACAFVSLALLARAALESLAPGIAYLVMLLPAVVLAGVFCGTRPAAVAAAAGGAVVAAFSLRYDARFLPLKTELVDLALFVPATVTVLWATGALRRTVSQAAAAEARLAEVFRQLPGAAVIVEAPDGRILLNSQLSRHILGHDRHEIRSADELARYQGVHPDGSRLAADEYPIVRALRRGEVVRAEPLRYSRPDGLIDLEVYAGPVRGTDGRIVAAVGMAFDVTDRVRAATQLAEREAASRALSERLSAALEVGGLGLWEVDLATRRLWCDGTSAAMLGLSAEPVELSRDQARRFFETEDGALALAGFERAVQEGGAFSGEFRVRSQRGEMHWLLVRGRVLISAGRAVGVARDVTERRQRENELQAAVQARELLLREADHRIKNSLQLVISLLTLQRGRLSDPEAADALSDAIARVNAVADAHLALQQSEDLQTIDVATMIHELCRRLGTLNPALHLRCGADGQILLAADKAIPLGLLLSEVVTNAMRHAYPPGQDGWIEVSAVVAAGELEVRVADGGCGMPAGSARRGLGSRVIASLVAQIGAVETTQSEPAGGTRVTLRLPLDDASRQEAPSRPEAADAGLPGP